MRKCVMNDSKCDVQIHHQTDNLAAGIYLLNTSKRCESNALLFSQAVAFFMMNGYRITGDITDCDTIVVNSCCVSEDKIEASQAALEMAAASGTGKRIILLGCLATLPNRAGLPENSTCIGPQEMHLLDRCFSHSVSIGDIPVNQLPPEIFSSGQGLKYGDFYILIAQGCSNHCSYCNIKRSKGGVKSVPFDDIAPQIRLGLSRGVREFSLLADDCGSYGDDCDTDLIRLLGEVLAIAPDFTLKLLYLYPEFLQLHFDELVPILGTGRLSFLHIPLQSGSQRMLALMNRNYDINSVMTCLQRIRVISPATKLVTHILVNFPTETENDFHASLSVADRFDESIFLQFSENRDTMAATILPKITATEATARLDAASAFVNGRRTGGGCVISDFNCTTPYNLLKGRR